MDNEKKQVYIYPNINKKEDFQDVISCGFSGYTLTTLSTKKFAVIKIKNNGKKYDLVRADNLGFNDIILTKELQLLRIQKVEKIDAMLEVNPDIKFQVVNLYFKYMNYDEVLKMLRV